MLRALDIPFDQHWLTRIARRILDDFADPARPGDYASLHLVVPNTLLIPGLVQALADEAGRPLLLPRIATLSGHVQPWVESLAPLPSSKRSLLLHAGLKAHFELEESGLWDLAGELAEVFDELTDHAVRLPEALPQLMAQIQRAYALRDMRPLGVEARMVHTLWRAEAQGRPSAAAARWLAIGKWLAWLGERAGDVCFLAEWGGEAFLRKLLPQDFAVRALILQPVRAPQDDAHGMSQTLAAAWPIGPEADPAPLLARAQRLAPAALQDFGARVEWLATDSLEDLAAGIADQVCDWLEAGRREIALIACDRVAARRVRALLERRAVLVEDETGWKLSTTRAAASVDAWLEVLSSDGYHRSLVDLVKSPFAFADMPPDARAEGVLQIERTGAQRGIVSGLVFLHEVLQADAETQAGAALLTRLLEAARAHGAAGELPIAQWLDRLQEALRALGALEALQADQAGAQWLEWMAQRRAELADDRSRFRFAAWRAWFNREMDAALFRDRSIRSPVVMTHLAAARLRRFEAAVLIGADAGNLRVSNGPRWLAHEGVRRELGLPGRDVARRILREDLAGLMLASGQTLIAWQASERGEEKLLAADLDLLMQSVRAAGGAQALRLRQYRRAPVVAAAVPLAMPAPVVPPDRQPAQVSASALRSLLSCPYQYFARYVLALGEVEELIEALEKRDFGELVHRILQRFHAAYPRLSSVARSDALAALQAHSDAVFAQYTARNFMDQAWRLRWTKRLESYLDWQLEREAAGWQVDAHETTCEVPVRLHDGRTLVLKGRIDRLDRKAGEQAVIDYKTQTIKALKDKLKDGDEVQLPFYALLQEGRPVEASFLALDDEAVQAVVQPELVAEAARIDALIRDVFTRIAEGERLPAMRPQALCGHCEMRGVCRKDWQAVEGDDA